MPYADPIKASIHNKAYNKIWNKTHSHIKKKWLKNKLALNPRYHWAAKLKHKYKMTVEEYDKLILQQNNSCAICFISFEGKNPHVDHDHLTQKIRGLLCINCNLGIGKLKDSPTRLIAAAEYLLRAGSFS